MGLALCKLISTIPLGKALDIFSCINNSLITKNIINTRYFEKSVYLEDVAYCCLLNALFDNEEYVKSVNLYEDINNAKSNFEKLFKL